MAANGIADDFETDIANQSSTKSSNTITNDKYL